MMKTFISTLALAVMLVLWNSSAGAVTIVGTTRAYSTINITLTITTNGTSTTKNDVNTYHTGNVKATNKTLLAMFAGWSTNDPAGWQAAGARLEFDWVADQLIVADKTGTNVLFYAGDGVTNGTVTAYFNIEWFNEDGPSTGSYNGKPPVTYTYKQATTAYFELYYQNTSNQSADTDLFSYGPNISNYSENRNPAKPKWTENESFNVNYCGTTYNNENTSQVVGTITTSGQGVGTNPYLD